MKHYLQSKTFWAATLAAVIEVLSALQNLPFLTEQQGHVVAALLVVFIAINRARK
jgi:hypothetical protein